MMLTLEDLGFDVECQHHEVATAGQAEIDMRFKPLLQMGDQLVWFKVRAEKRGIQRRAYPLPSCPNPSSRTTEAACIPISVSGKKGPPLFAGDKYAGISQEALYAIGGILKHCKSLCAFTNPTTNSYKRLVPGFEAPVNLAYSSRNRSASSAYPHVFFLTQSETYRVQNAGSVL